MELLLLYGVLVAKNYVNYNYTTIVVMSNPDN